MKSIIKRVNSRILTLLMTVFLVSSIVAVPVDTVYAASSVKIGQATSGENGKLRNCKAGDQSGKEVSITSWTYSSKSGVYNNWKYIYRAKDDAVSKKIASAMKATCDNNHVGYDQSGKDRGTFYDEAKKVNWNISKITKDCETTCASVASVCLNAAGISAPRYMDSSTIQSFFKGRTDFITIKDSKYTSKDTYLEAGDILVSPGKHTCIVISSPNTPTGSSSAKPATSTKTLTFKAGKEYTLVTDLNVRSGASKKYGIVKYSDLSSDAKKHAVSSTLAVLKKGTVVSCLKVSGSWIKIPSGWICGQEGDNVYIKEYTAPKKTTTQTSAVSLKVGKDYKLRKTLNVRTGPGTKYSIKKRSSLTTNARAHSYNSKYAKLKSGTVVTCVKVSASWIKIPSGWICAKTGNVVAVK